jgi:hypothetical protein
VGAAGSGNGPAVLQHGSELRLTTILP